MSLTTWRKLMGFSSTQPDTESTHSIVPPLPRDLSQRRHANHIAA